MCKCVLFAPKEGYSSTSKEYKNVMDLKKTKKKNKNAFGVQQHTNWYKRVSSSVTQSSRYRSIYIDWQRSYDE